MQIETKTEVVTTKSFTIKLDEDEALKLMVLFGSLGGKSVIRDITNDLYGYLYDEIDPVKKLNANEKEILGDLVISR